MVTFGAVVELPPGAVVEGLSLEKEPPGLEKLRLPLEKPFGSGEV